jgi:hypothetical protein
MDKMAFYELEELIDSLKMLAEKEEEEKKKKEGSSNNGFNMSQMQRQMKSSLPSNMGSGVPNIPSFPNMNF